MINSVNPHLAELHREALETYLRSAVGGDWSPEAWSAPVVLQHLAELLTFLPMVYMSLLVRALKRTGTKQEDITVLPGIGLYGQALAVQAGDLRIGEVRFVTDHSNGFMMLAYINLTQEAINLIDEGKDTESTTDAA